MSYVHVSVPSGHKLSSSILKLDSLLPTFFDNVRIGLTIEDVVIDGHIVCVLGHEQHHIVLDDDEYETMYLCEDSIGLGTLAVNNTLRTRNGNLRTFVYFMETEHLYLLHTLNITEFRKGRKIFGRFCSTRFDNRYLNLSEFGNNLVEDIAGKFHDWFKMLANHYRWFDRGLFSFRQKFPLYKIWDDKKKITDTDSLSKDMTTTGTEPKLNNLLLISTCLRI